MRPEESLSPCPFCGGSANLSGGETIHWSAFVECMNDLCLAKPTVNCETRAEAITAWNRRSPTPEHGGREGLPPVERIECVSYERGYEEPASPAWRVRVGDRCADFETETAANGFRDAILSLSASLGGGEGSSVAESGGTPRLRVGEAKSEGQCKSEEG